MYIDFRKFFQEQITIQMQINERHWEYEIYEQYLTAIKESLMELRERDAMPSLFSSAPIARISP